jgi:hypothetical protein
MLCFFNSRLAMDSTVDAIAVQVPEGDLEGDV